MIELAHMADNSGTVRHSQAVIATLTLLSRVTIANEMKKLEAKKLIVKEAYGKYKVNVLLEKLRAPIANELVKDNESSQDAGKHQFELWCAHHSEELEQGTFLLVSEEDTSTNAADYEEQGLIKRVGDETIIYKDGFYFVYGKVD